MEEDLEQECQRLREAICAISEAREQQDFDGLMRAIDDAFSEAALSALRRSKGGR